MSPPFGAQGPGLALLGLQGAPLALASRSPRRRELLQRLQIPLILLEADVPEVWDGRQPPDRYVERLAQEKLDAALQRSEVRDAYACLTADTVVAIDGLVLEKPEDRAHAIRLLDRLSGRWHDVWTGLALARVLDGKRCFLSTRTRVRLDLESGPVRDLYLETGEPMDKSGAYGIQGWGGIFVPEIEGDFFNVMGLPLSALRRLCRELEEG
ncbi:MAG: septum formation protein Maf [Candidatus Eisenbacteria bacterium]|uniref:dTTP/UTP pyrophosphatase n=1 Tax=Eiseniibacteriota bacterium TaxID=2212470 RepID=A0A956LY89_UNCEI|nr:septum formation protein Maf [Candidatus Eisenbacteria bacterium]